ncbi:guanylate-binding protein 1-like [Anguilla anguilla]|uniref:guanylate-binding protein 1-like n=1 Tax=Anguilla anguilla TaxID=7936 RepID=UPI0015B2A00D|nr:guanylate-binding protein 1-like [Anguilla anguilla]XP_035275268.1 guanylate-binding protein 1-like [Anguilla anguilla]
MDRPVCLIENTSAGELQVNQESLDILRSIRQPVVVVSIVGLYRTGKSYLMNRLAGKTTGFPLGSTVQSETKGIWMWCVPHPHRDDQTLVLLDTEGLGDVEKGDQNNDTWIFSLAVLLSSTLVYNSMGTINNETVMSLHYVTELTEHIKVKSTEEETEETSSDYVRFFPTFIWAVRDFTLELEINGEAVTADEYLENSLKPKNGSSRAVALSNDARECIRNYFPERKCFVFDQPGSKEKLKLLDQLADSELDPQFMKQTSDFCSYIFSCSKVKTVKSGITATGSLLGNLAVTYVDAIRSGNVPCLENAVAALSQIENSVAVEESFALYRQLLGERVKLHTKTQKELSSAHDGCLKEALQLFMKRSFKDEDQKYQAALMERVKNAYEEKCAENEEMSRNHCAALLLQLEQGMDMDPVEAYMKPGGYQGFKGQLNKLVKLYRRKPAKGVKAEEALANYLSEKNRLGKIILTTDEKMSEQQKHLKEQRAQLEEEKQRAAAAREQQMALVIRTNDIERARQENERQLMERMERDREELLKQNRELRMLCVQLAERPARIIERIETHERIVERNTCVLS